MEYSVAVKTNKINEASVKIIANINANFPITKPTTVDMRFNLFRHSKCAGRDEKSLVNGEQVIVAFVHPFTPAGVMSADFNFQVSFVDAKVTPDQYTYSLLVRNAGNSPAGIDSLVLLAEVAGTGVVTPVVSQSLCVQSKINNFNK